MLKMQTKVEALKKDEYQKVGLPIIMERMHMCSCGQPDVWDQTGALFMSNKSVTSQHDKFNVYSR